MEYCDAELPAYKPLSVSGYHIREAGSTAAQELAFTLADGFGYVELGLSRGLDIDRFAPGLSFFFDAHIDFFEEIAKFRAARRIWARWLRDRYGATTARAQSLRFHTQTAGVSLTAQQPYNNVVRTAVEALAAVLGGTNSLHTNALDETLALPTEGSAEIALRTQQVLAEETGVANVADPLGGSWYVEALTDQIEQEAEAIFAQIEELGGGADREHPIGPMTSGSCCGGSRTAGSPARSPRPRTAIRPIWRRATSGSSASTATRRRSAARWRSCGWVTRSSIEQNRVLAARRAARDQSAVDAALAEMIKVARTSGRHDPADAGRGPRRGDPGRDLRRVAGRVGRVHRSRPASDRAQLGPAAPYDVSHDRTGPQRRQRVAAAGARRRCRHHHRAAGRGTGPGR